MFRKLFKKNTPPFKIQEGHVVKKAFYKDGVQYYELHDMFNTFTQRGMDAMAVYENWNMRCSRQFLLDHTKAIDKIYSNPKTLNIPDAITLNTMLKERLQWALPTEEIIWQFMAVAYFDENESPYKYDNSYGEEKIARWKKNNKIEDFFLSVPIKDLIPLPDISERDLKIYLTTISKMDLKHLEKISSLLSPNLRNRDSSTRLPSDINSVVTSAN